MSERIIIRAPVSQQDIEGEEVDCFVGMPVNTRTRIPLPLPPSVIAVDCVEAVILGDVLSPDENDEPVQSTGVYVYDHHGRSMLVDVIPDLPCFTQINLN